MANLISIGKVALYVGVSVDTIQRWYRWMEDSKYEHPEGLTLPPYYHTDARRTKMFDSEGVSSLKKFKKLLNTEYKGVMSDYNAEHQWGNRGKDILERKHNHEQNEN